MGDSQTTDWGRVYGGQVLAQGLAAAQLQTSPDRDVHSFHSYFLRPGNPDLPIIYEVECTLEAGTISNRRIVAKQGGKPSCVMAASFQLRMDGLTHRKPMPTVPEPEDTPLELISISEEIKLAPADWSPKFIAHQAIEFRNASDYDFLSPKTTEPVKRLWMRPRGTLPEDRNVHQYLLAYASDFFFLNVATQPHGLSFITENMRMATIDHSMWYHRDFDFNDWLLYDMESPSASNGRGFVTGRVYDRAGRLVASSTQEGIMRISNKK